MTANKIGDGTYTGALIQTHGPAFNSMPFSPALVTRTTVGAGTLTFTDGDNGTFIYTVNAVQQTKAITRQVLGTLPACTYVTQPNFAQAVNYQDLWWAAAGAESDWGINLTHQGDNIFVTWFTYDVDGTRLWLSATAAKLGPGVYSGQLIRTGGPAFSAVPFNPSLVTRTLAGVWMGGNRCNHAAAAANSEGLTKRSRVSRIPHITDTRPSSCRTSPYNLNARFVPLA